MSPKKILRIILIFTGVLCLILFNSILFKRGINDNNPLNDKVCGSVDGNGIMQNEYLETVEDFKIDFKIINGREPSADEIKTLKVQVWEQLVSFKIMNVKCNDLGINASDKEINDAMKDPALIPEKYKNHLLYNNGIDTVKADNLLKSIEQEDEKTKEEVKFYIGKFIKYKKLREIITVDVKLTDEEIKKQGSQMEQEKLLERKKNSEFVKWLEEQKKKAVIVDNREKLGF